MEPQLLLYVFGLALSLVAFFLPSLAVCYSGEGDLELGRIRDEFNCLGLYGSTSDETEELLQQCQQLMRTSVMQNSREYLMKATPEELQAARFNYIVKHPKFSLRTKRALSGGCPVMNEEYLRVNKHMNGMRSISPYKQTIDYNPNRYPKYLTRSECLCAGCIDPHTGKETLSYLSHSITAITAVFHSNAKNEFTTTRQEIDVGCTCIRPSTL